MSFQVGDIVRRVAPFEHEGHQMGHICKIAEIIENSNYFRDGEGRTTLFGNLVQYKMSNYELVSRGPIEKKKSGFGKWISSRG